MNKIEIGSRVKLTKPAYKWDGWVDSMTELVNKEFTVRDIKKYTGYNNFDYLQNGIVKLQGIDYNFPAVCFELVEENTISTKFKVGDRVRVVKQIDRENGWDNFWVSEMSNSIGRIYTISEINGAGVYFSDSNSNLYDFGFPPSSLELVSETAPVIKYQYLKGSDYCFWVDNLCLTIATKIKTSKITGLKTVEWSVAFKNPKDQFDKKLARAAVNPKTPKRIFLGKKYSREEIVTKILADLFYNDYFLSKEYREFVRYLLFKFAQEI